MPDPTAVLDLTSDHRGILIPRLSTSERTGISGPATGLLVYDTDANSFWYFDGTTWVDIAAAGGGGGGGTAGWALTGNAGTNPATDFIGTTDDQPLRFKVNNAAAGLISSGAPFNTALGEQSLEALTTGEYNAAFGATALNQNTTGNNNTALGRSALYQTTTGGDNPAAGSAEPIRSSACREGCGQDVEH